MLKQIPTWLTKIISNTPAAQGAMERAIWHQRQINHLDCNGPNWWSERTILKDLTIGALLDVKDALPLNMNERTYRRAAKWLMAEAAALR